MDRKLNQVTQEMKE